jgi:hypothetical protein
MDNLDPNDAGTQEPATTETTPPVTTTTPPAPVTPTVSETWKGKLGEDLANAPLVQNFEDTPEGFKKQVESHVNLEKLLGHEKIPMPKGPDDVEGQARFNKAMGVPETGEGYNLPDANLPGDLSKMTFDKGAFANVAKDLNLTPNQATGLWNKYVEMSGTVYQGHMTTANENLNKSINALRAEWGDTYAVNIELGEMVVAKFAQDQNSADFITASLSKDPAGQRFLAKIGSQFAENKLGEFQFKKFSSSPEEAAEEANKIKNDPKHPYSNMAASQKEHDAAVDHVNRLISISRGKRS